MSGYAYFRYANTVLADGAEEIITLIQRSKRRYRNILWNMKSITMHKRSYGHPLYLVLTPYVLTCVLPLGTAGSGREYEVDSAHLSLTLI